MRLRTAGRGGGYSPLRGFLESILRIAYRGDWPARVWSRVPKSCKVFVTRHRLRLPTGSGEACRIVFVSDLHVGPTTPIRLLEDAFATVRQQAPDVLLLGGDYVFLDAEPHRLSMLSQLVESVTCQEKLAVLGNHDLWTSDGAIVEALTRAGVRVLVNEAVPLPQPWSDVVDLGLDDPWTGQCDPHVAAAQANGEPIRIVLCHSPDGLKLLSGLRFDLFLCGHTHGGQVAAPWGPIVLPHGPMCRTFPSGFRPFGSGTVYISRGIGGVELPIRTFAPPDIMLLELFRPSDSENERAAEQGDEADEAQGGTRMAR